MSDYNHDYHHHNYNSHHHHDQYNSHVHHNDHHYDHHHRPLSHHHSFHSTAAPMSNYPLDQYSHHQDTFRIFTKAGENYSLSIRNGDVILVFANPHDEYQQWYKDFRWGAQVKDEAGYPAFALINKATGLAVKHALGPKQPVRLIPFNPQYLDESILWTESHDVGEGFHCIRMVNNIRLNFDAFHGDHGVHDETPIMLWEWKNGHNQMWKIVSHSNHSTRHFHHGISYNNRAFRIFSRAGKNYSLSVRNGEVVLVHTNHRDDFQHWYKDMRWGSEVKDEAGYSAFALINKATGLAIKHSVGPKHPVRLIPFNPEYLDESILWTESHDIGKGFRCIRMVNNIRLNFDAFQGDKKHGGIHEGTAVVLWEWINGKNQSWKIVPFH